MPSEQMQAIVDALRHHIPQGGSLTVAQHRAMHDALLARRPPDKDVRIEATSLGGVAAEWVWAEGVPAGRALPAVRESSLPLPVSAFALSPLTDLTLSSPAMADPACRDPLARDGRQFAEAVHDYLPEGQNPAAPLVSPLYADWSGLPAVHIEVGGTERLIDDARRLVERARLAGVPATLEVTDGAVHAFPATAPETPEAAAAIERIANHLMAGMETADSARLG
jgi:alpha/beta hydrolase fold